MERDDGAVNTDTQPILYIEPHFVNKSRQHAQIVFALIVKRVAAGGLN